jgi:hypothetical protein
MNAKWVVISLSLLLVLGLAGFALSAGGLLGPREVPVSDGMPVPGHEGEPEMVVGSGMPVPGVEGVEEAVVGSQMPVPGLEGVDEMIVADD